MVSCESLQLSMDRKLAPFDTEEDFWEHVTNAQGKRKSNAGMSRIPSAIPGSPTAHANVAGAPGIRAEEVAAGTHRHGGQARASEGLLVSKRPLRATRPVPALGGSTRAPIPSACEGQTPRRPGESPDPWPTHLGHTRGTRCILGILPGPPHVWCHAGHAMATVAWKGGHQRSGGMPVCRGFWRILAGYPAARTNTSDFVDPSRLQ